MPSGEVDTSVLVSEILRAGEMVIGLPLKLYRLPMVLKTQGKHYMFPV